MGKWPHFSNQCNLADGNACCAREAWRGKHSGSVAQIGGRADFSFPRTDLFHDLRDGNAERGVAVQHGNTNLELRHLTVEVPRHEALTQQFRYADLRFTQCILVSTRLRRWYPLHRRQSARPKYFDARRASLRATAPAVTVFHGFAFLRGGMIAAAPRSAMASWHFRVS